MSINQSTNYAAATGNAFPCEINPSLSIATLAEGLVMDDAKVQFRESLERIYDLWKSMVQKYTLPSTTACNDPCIVKVLHDLAGDFKNADASVSRFASVLSARLMDSLQSRIKSDRRARKVILRKRADSIVTDMHFGFAGFISGGHI
ncbi:hypothetical protein FPHYL_14178 [Fusarium phyllophilum]|uniref:Uncharacterized protein n=1 Tax=Fusarium phyllophilum TaxID=47803 RepID=A0A8H5MHD8_9HYPO|nr:hypothetical protein FPHYL_14178 [Fusarium phyllophilum]